MSFIASRRNLIVSTRRPIEAWFDMEREGWAIAILLMLFVLLWTAFHVVSRASVDLNPDLVEMYAWSRHPSAGYYKHPPLGALIAAAWFAVLPATDWSFDLLAMVNAAVALFAVHRIARLYLPADKALLAVLLLLLTPFYQFQAQRFGANQALLSTWPIATYCFLRAFHTRAPVWAAIAGATAGLAMLGKYYSVYLVAALVLGALSHPARSAYLRSASPWISVAVGSLVLAPHLYWLTTVAFTPFDYVYVAHGGASRLEVLASAATYLAGGIGYVALPIAVYALIVRPDRRLLLQTLWPADADRRLLVVLLGAQLLLPALSAPFLGVPITSLWTMQSWFLLPIVLLAPEAAVVSRPRAVTVAASVLAIAALALLAAPAIAFITHVSGTRHGEPFYRLVSEEITREWHSRTGRPLTIVMGNAVEAVTFYSRDHPDAVPEFDLRAAPWVTPARLAREGYAVLCDHPACAAEIARRAAAEPNAVRGAFDVSRRYLGQEGSSARFTILIVPPPSGTGDAPR